MEEVLDVYIPVFNRLGYKVTVVEERDARHTLRFERPVRFGPLKEHEAANVFWPTSRC